MVKYPSIVFAESGGSEPGGYGSSSGEGEQCADDERQEKRFDLRFEFAGESFGDGLKEFEGGMLSLQNHGSAFWDEACLVQTILYTERRLLVKTNFAKFLERAVVKLCPENSAYIIGTLADHLGGSHRFWGSIFGSLFENDVRHLGQFFDPGGKTYIVNVAVSKGFAPNVVDRLPKMHGGTPVTIEFPMIEDRHLRISTGTVICPLADTFARFILWPSISRKLEFLSSIVPRGG